MESRLGLYDLLTRLVPGGAFLWGLSLFVSASEVSGIPVEGGLAVAASFVVVSYVAGVFLDTIGRLTAEALFFGVFGKPSEQLLLKSSGNKERQARRYRHIAIKKGLLPRDATFERNETGKSNSHSACLDALTRYDGKSEKMRSISAQYILHRSLIAACLLLLIPSINGLATNRLDWAPTVVISALAVVFFMALSHWGYTMFKVALNMLEVDDSVKER